VPIATGASAVALPAAQVALRERSSQDLFQGRHLSHWAAAAATGGAASLGWGLVKRFQAC